MDQGKALIAMGEGKKVKLPEWRGYWFMSNGKFWAATKDGMVAPAWLGSYTDRQDFEITDGRYGGVELTDIFAIARVCHSANDQWCRVNNDFTQKEWYSAQDWQRESMIKGVIYQLENPDAPVSGSHDAWMAHKISEGWSYGPEKDPIRLLHPCIVPYDQLPIFQQAKDALFKGIVAALRKVYVPL